MKLLEQFLFREYRVYFPMAYFMDRELLLPLERFGDEMMPVDLRRP